MSTLQIGDKVRTKKWGWQLDSKVFTVVELRHNAQNCQSGTLVLISGYKNWLDSDWLEPIPHSN